MNYVDAEIVLVPSLMAQTRLAVQVCDPSNAMLAYPARTIDAPAATSLSSLLGRGRATVLQALDADASTSDLSDQLDLAPATVSHHRQVLLHAGLVDRTRQGHRVLYARTSTGNRLLDNTV